jgi:hypothetical protein
MCFIVKRDQEAPAIQALEAFLVTIIPFEHNIVISLNVLPDKGTNVTATPL